MEDLGEWPTRYDPLSLSKSASPLGKHGMPHAQLAYDLPNAARSTAVTRTPSRGSPFLLALQSVGGRSSVKLTAKKFSQKVEEEDEDKEEELLLLLLLLLQSEGVHQSSHVIAETELSMLSYLAHGTSLLLLRSKFCMASTALLCFHFTCGPHCWRCLEVVRVFTYRTCTKGYHFCFECWKGIEDKVIRPTSFSASVESAVETSGMSSFLCERIRI
uniref:Uncharacterized protein n=1 Tax=Physcomitrium patens TaxID=3218 RepID=A0A2K1IJK0_PHYPA|nr:hypothetical protein PHYPA_028149 [Physcomitrium patens]